MITASDFAQALGFGKFGTQTQFIINKSGYSPSDFNWNVPPLKWGSMYEDVACKVYERFMGSRVHEFGLLTHPTEPWIGASPDGISDLGVMVEIKCPYRRKIDGQVPQQYYYQIQGQLEVTGLRDCDYIEVELSEYYSFRDMEEDSAGVCSTSGTDRGVVVEFANPDVSQPPTYAYSDLGLTPVELQAFVDAAVRDRPAPTIRLHYYKVVRFHICRVTRDDAFVKSTIDGLRPVWDRVLRYRVDPDLYHEEVGRTEEAKQELRKTRQIARDAAAAMMVCADDENDGAALTTGYAFVDDSEDDEHLGKQSNKKLKPKRPAKAASKKKYPFVDDDDD